MAHGADQKGGASTRNENGYLPTSRETRQSKGGKEGEKKTYSSMIHVTETTVSSSSNGSLGPPQDLILKLTYLKPLSWSLHLMDGDCSVA